MYYDNKKGGIMASTIKGFESKAVRNKAAFGKDYFFK